MEDEKLLEVLPILRREYDAAVNKHPEFPKGEGGVAIIAEELGELAQEYNDKKEGWRERAKKEAAHVAVTALREMIALDDEEQKENQNGTSGEGSSGWLT